VYSQVGGDLLSSLKMIVILREPVSRLRSLHNHMRTEFLNKKNSRIAAWYDQVASANGTVTTFDQYSETVGKEHILYGKYVDHLRKWVDLFSRDQLLVLSYDEVQVDPDKVQWRIQEFLGGSFPGKLPRVNTQGGGTKTKTVSSHASQILGPLFEVKNDELYEFLDSDHRPSMQQYISISSFSFELIVVLMHWNLCGWPTLIVRTRPVPYRTVSIDSFAPSVTVDVCNASANITASARPFLCSDPSGTGYRMSSTSNE
jgi:hypothetical protein